MTQTITVDASRLTATKQETKRILEELYTLYGTREGTVGMCRDFGLSWEAVDMPPETAKAMMSAEIVEKTVRFIAGVRIVRVEWSRGEGELSGKVVIENG